MTGASGGGYNTWITAALDDRIAAAVPVVGTSEFAEQIRVCRPLDWYHAAEHCHFVPGLIRYANNHELLAMAAPKPVLIIAASQDQSFPVAGVREVADYGRELYTSYGAGEKLGLVVDEAEGHGYQRAKREAAYGWFLRWLMRRGDGGPHPEPPTKTEPFDSEELRCFPPGRNEPAGPAMIEAVRRLARDLPPSPPRIDLGAVLGPMPSAPPARVQPRRRPAPAAPGPVGGGARRPRVPAPAGGRGPGRARRPRRPREGGARLGPGRRDGPRPGLGGLRRGPPRHRRVGHRQDRLGVRREPAAGGELRRPPGLGPRPGARGPRRRPVRFPASPSASTPGARTLASRPRTRSPGRPTPEGARLRWYLLRDGFLSYRAFLDRPKSLPASYRLLPEDRDRTTAFDREIPASFFAFDALRSFDLPQLLATSRARGLIVNPRDGDRGRLPEEAARSLLPPSVRAVSAEEPGPRVGEFLHEVLGPGGRGGWTRSGTRSRGPGVVAPPPRRSGLTARRGARGGAGRDARAGRPVAGAGGQPEGEPGVGWGEDPRRLGEVPRAPPACPAGVARAALRRPPGPRGCSSRGRWKATATGSRTSSSRAGRGWW